MSKLVRRLRKIVPDISHQESRANETGDYWELKRRGLQAFQCSLMLETLVSSPQPEKKLTIVDIGDSAGTHMLYLKELAKHHFEIDTISVNLDPRAIEKIRARGLTAILSRAEDLEFGNKSINLFTSFEMVEHLHNPAIFFYRLAKKSTCNRLLMTVPFVSKSRIGLHHVRLGILEKIFAEDEHIFELSPTDWTLLIRHSGWKIIKEKVYYQYPRKLSILGGFWRHFDFEGFWGAILEKDSTFSDCYHDWET